MDHPRVSEGEHDDRSFAELLSKFMAREDLDQLRGAHAIEGWFMALSREPETLCVALGFFHESCLAKHPVFARVMKSFFVELEERLKATSQLPALVLMCQILDDESGSCRQQNRLHRYYLQGRRIAIQTRVARVMSTFDLRNMVSKYNPSLCLPPRESDSTFERKIQRGGIDEFLSRCFSRPPFWFVTEGNTLMIMLDQVLPSEKATVARDKLGLLHRQENIHLVAVSYDCGSRFLKCPTIFDGYGYPLFRPAPGDWGTTVDLSSHGTGLPEAIHGPLPLSGNPRALFLGCPVHCEFNYIAYAREHQSHVETLMT
jgi:hypothetical protein